MSAVPSRPDVARHTMAYRPAAGGGTSLVDVQRSDRRILLKRTPVDDPAGAYRQRITVTRVSDPAVLEGIADGLQAGPVAFTMSVADQTRSVTLTPLGNAGVRAHVEDLADVTLPGDGDGGTTTSALTGGELFVIVLLVAIVAGVGVTIVKHDPDGGACEVEAEPDDQQPSPSGNQG